MSTLAIVLLVAAVAIIGTVVSALLARRDKRRARELIKRTQAETRDKVLGLQVWDALDRAVENDYGTWLRRAAVPEIADDLLDHDSDFEGCTREQLVPHVRSWRAQDRL